MASRAEPGWQISILSLTVSSIFLCVGLYRLVQLRRAPTKSAASFQAHVKAGLSILLMLSTLENFVSIAGPPYVVAGLYGADSLITLFAAVLLSRLSWLEHRRNTRPSDLIVTYLLFCLIRDTLMFIWASAWQYGWASRAPVNMARIIIEAALLATENSQKEQSEELLSAEETSGILTRTFFAWIGPFLAHGYRTILTGSELPRLDSLLSSATIRESIIQSWEQRSTPEKQTTLPSVLLSCLRKPLLLAIPPRILLIIFKYSQPALIRKTIDFVTRATLQDEVWTGQTLVILAIVVYTGLAVSTAVYQHCLNRLRIMVRGALAALVHHKMMRSYSATSSEGRILTLLNTDIDTLDTVAEMLHETWGQAVEVVIGLALLSREVGWLFPIPVVIIIACSRVSQYVARNLRTKQGNWNAATQSRLSMTSAVLGAIKNVKMTGLQDIMNGSIHSWRESEMKMAGKVRLMMVAYNASANALGMFAPVLTVVLYAVLARSEGRGLDPATIFTTVALLTMVTHPANMVMTIVPRAVAAYPSFERIQVYLLENSIEDHRMMLTALKTPLEIEGDRETENLETDAAIEVSRLRVGKQRAVLNDISLTVQKGSVTVCTGETSSGKSLFVQSILGEVPPEAGEIRVSSKRVAYCPQAPWLPNSSVKNIITQHGPNPANDDAAWYENVVDACCLAEDFAALPMGDQTVVGSRGMNLSGGQRQRLALARAVFSRAEILILDDPFSALDGKTENHVIKRLLSPNGICRELGLTVLIISNAVQAFQLADKIVILDNGHITQQGRWDTMKIQSNLVSKMTDHDAKPRALRDPITYQSAFQAQEQVLNDGSKLARKMGDSALYGFYVEAAGRLNFVMMVAFTASWSFFVTVPQYWLKWWTESGTEHSYTFIGGYIALALVAWISTNGIMCAPLSYFSITDTGSILNLQDLQLVDKQLPSAMSSLSVQIFKLIVQVVLLVISQKYLALTLPICLVVVYVVQKVYLRTSRQLRLLELESKSAVLTDFLETAEGLPTIRAIGDQSKTEQQHLIHLDNSQTPLYLLLCLQAWLKLVLDLLVTGIAVGVIVLAVALRNTTSGGHVGVALNVVLVANTTLMRLVESWTNLEISLGAIARLRGIEATVPSESLPWEISIPPDTWPSAGSLEIENLTACHSDESNTVLKNLSLRVLPGQKVVVCGRTGSGKSSLLLALLRLLKIKTGSIKLDGCDLHRVGLSAIRERCFVTVPQDALVFNQASLRFNVDPTESLSNDTIIETLVKVKLWEHLSSTEDSAADAEHHSGVSSMHPILDVPLLSLPQLSSGQGQLLALARALLHVHRLSTGGARPIILLDEATSSLDPDTELLILDIIDRELTCKHHTVIVVAHRLSVATSRMRPGTDIVVCMRDGEIERIDDVGEDIIDARSTIEEPRVPPLG
ncbi:ABC transporter [Xylariomycetidae sp. FL2044]|nr:ABC transporter [Xylariomycetidae sp. FL2044]